MRDIIYFDSAATTFQKPSSVYIESDRCLREYCGNSGRGSHMLALKSAEKIYECRAFLADMFLSSPENVIFTQNTTYALNMAIQGILKDGDHVIISNLEHNSVLRPIHNAHIQKKVEYTIFDAYCGGFATTEKVLSNIRHATRKNTCALVCTHASNICSSKLPLKEIGEYCFRHGIIFIVDGAQSAGHEYINMEQMNIDILCMPAHKGLFGLQGCGVMILRSPKILPESIMFGGSGVNSLSPFMPDEPPEKYEAGTLPTPAIAGLCEGLRFLRDMGIENISRHEKFLWERAYGYLKQNKRIKIYDRSHAGSVMLFNILGIDSDKVGEYLSERGICVRSGYHCAPLAHKTLNTAADNCSGAVRVSFSIFNTASEVDTLCYEISAFRP